MTPKLIAAIRFCSHRYEETLRFIRLNWQFYTVKTVYGLVGFRFRFRFEFRFMLEKHHVWFRAPGSVAGNVLKSHQNDAVLNMAGEVQNMWHVVLLPQTWLETTWCSTMTVLLHRWRSGLTYFLCTQVNVSLLSSCSSSLHTHSFLSVCLCEWIRGCLTFQFHIWDLFIQTPTPPPTSTLCCCRLLQTQTGLYCSGRPHTDVGAHTHTRVCVCVSGFT